MDADINMSIFRELQSKEAVRYENMMLIMKGGQQKLVELISNAYMVEDWKVIQCNIREMKK